MARPGKKESTADEQKTILKKKAFSTNILSQKPGKVGPTSALAPSKTVIKHHGKDILKKSQRKNKFLFSFPGLLGTVSGGKIGELKDIGTQTPVLYLHFPQGQMKLFGTIVYPKNRYLTLQFSRGGKNVTCDDYFDNMIVFSDAWWVGTKEENPEELQLPFPEDLNTEKHAESDFKGGVGVTCDRKQVSTKSAMKHLEPESPKVDTEDDLDVDSPNDYKELMGVTVTPTRHSARTAGRTFKFAEGSSGDDFVGTGTESSEEDDIETESSGPPVLEVDNEGVAKQDAASGKRKVTTKANNLSSTGPTPLVQTTLSSMFKKVETKNAQKDVKEKSKSKTKASGALSSKKVQANLFPASQSSDPDNNSTQAEDDDIEDFSPSKDMDATSDEDWTA